MSKILTKRLVLRPYTADDRDGYLDLVTDSAVMRHIEGGAVKREVAEDWWHRLLNGLYPTGVRWCVCALEDRRYVGHAMINFTRPENACELGYLLRESEWGKGYATEIAKAVAKYSRDEMGMPEIYGTVDEGFEPSINVLKKAGMKFFGYDSDKNGRYLVFVLVHERHREIE